VYRRGLMAWFQADDFAWLGLRLQVSDWQSLIRVMFAPMAQGTIRPWSERAFFLGLQSLFGSEALPFRICVFLTQFANLTLVAAITRRITGSRAAGLWAAIFWEVNVGIALVMVWTSAYNQVLCGFFLLGAFWFLLRYIDTGQRRDCAWQWVFFLMGFGALEINVVYPALAALYACLFARSYLRSTLPLFLPSILFTVADRMVAPSQTGGAYALHFDGALPQTFVRYCFRALMTGELPDWMKGGPDVTLASVLGLALIGFTIARAVRKDWLPVFCIGWFVIVLAPVLPLRDHVADYYVALPSIGLAILGSYALANAWRSATIWKAAAVVLAAAYLMVMVRGDRVATRWWYDRSKAVERMVLGVVRARQLHPAEGILLDGVDTNLFWAGVYDNPFHAFGVYGVYLTPGSERSIDKHPELANVLDFVLPSGPTLRGLNNNEIVVYRPGPKRLKAITSLYADTTAQQLSPEVPRRVDVGNPLLGYLLGPEWYSSEDGLRWMPKRATLRIGGPRSPSEKLYVRGYCPVQVLPDGPVPVRITVAGVQLPEITLRNCSFDLSLPLPAQAMGKEVLDVTVEAGRARKVGPHAVDFALRFGVFEIR